jgi:hypothetical protein
MAGASDNSDFSDLVDHQRTPVLLFDLSDNIQVAFAIIGPDPTDLRLRRCWARDIFNIHAGFTYTPQDQIPSPSQFELLHCNYVVHYRMTHDSVYGQNVATSSPIVITPDDDSNHTSAVGTDFSSHSQNENATHGFPYSSSPPVEFDALMNDFSNLDISSVHFPVLSVNDNTVPCQANTDDSTMNNDSTNHITDDNSNTGSCNPIFYPVTAHDLRPQRRYL